MNRKVLAILPLLLCVLFMLPAQKSEAAVGVTGKLAFGVSSILLDSPVAIKAYDLETTTGFTYAIEIATVEKFQWVTTGDSSAERVFYYTFTDADVSSNIITIELLSSSGGSTLHTYYLAPTTVDTFFPDELIFALFVPILIAVILVAIVLVIRRRKGG